MNPDKQMTPNLEGQSPLRLWFSHMSDDDRLVIETHIIDGLDAPMDYVLDTIQDQEKARGVMTRLRAYLGSKEDGTSAEQLRLQAKEIREYIGSVIGQ